MVAVSQVTGDSCCPLTYFGLFVPHHLTHEPSTGRSEGAIVAGCSMEGGLRMQAAGSVNGRRSEAERGWVLQWMEI